MARPQGNQHQRGRRQMTETTLHAFKSDLWNEDDGDVLWWKFPIEEAPYVGSPLDEEWPGYHTHFTYIKVPENPNEE